jgi:diaminopimelate epimerase
LDASGAQAKGGESIDQDVSTWPAEKVESLGKPIESYMLFPEKTNVEFVNILSRNHIRMKVWERGAGMTQACGSGACAVVVAAIRRGLVERENVTVTLDGGDLTISWPSDDSPVSMTGPVTYVFEGTYLLTE